jgi:Rad3-related DNA helicase
MSSILDNWIFQNKPPYATQIEALQWLEANIDIKYHILELPVGAGKSAIAMTWSRFLKPETNGSSYILTPQKILQQQYFDTMPDLGILKGKNNYQCGMYPTVSCDVGGILGCNAKDRCTYALAKKEALMNNPNVVLNYHNGLMLFKYSIMAQRPLLVIDECHNLEMFLTEFDAFVITDEYIKQVGCIKYQKTTNPVDIYEWIIGTYLPKAIARHEELESELESMKNDGTSVSVLNRYLKEFSTLSNHLEDIQEILESGIENFFENYVMVMDDTSVKFKSLFPRSSFQKYVSPYGEHVLLMSGTILDKHEFCSNLGIPDDEAEFISMESEFDVDKRPVFFMPTMKMNKEWNDDYNAENRVKLVDTIMNLLDIHKDQSGIIHTSNFAISKWLLNELNSRGMTHDIYHHTKLDNTSISTRDEAIENFIQSTTPSVLISPSITEGLDLKDELSRFAIIIKVPYPSMGDQWIKRRMTISSNWYAQLTLRGIIQGAGRVVRHQTDYGNVYILDTSWQQLYKNTKQWIPKWWHDAYEVLK